jgi:hypothetical protein
MIEKLKDVTAFSGAVATISLERVNIALSILVGLFTLLFLIPGVIHRWRGIFHDYKIYKSHHGSNTFFRFIFDGMPDDKKPLQSSDENRDD